MRRAIRTLLALSLVMIGPAGAEQPPPKLIDINTATVEELEALPAIGEARAQMIVRIRERNGPFKRVEELRALPRLSEKQFEALRKWVTVGSEDQQKQAPR
jgi:competence protein ComEA